eukprot:GDKJ01030285.1.p1 GENE.GDKJ01030285.1~~GDKJ01030285.1.p1  ORF type:complete len:1113 (+),score=257.90 GDKJ01030285.1:343-3339(+)
MKPYQLEGLMWMAQMHQANLNCILADEMGLGKTLQSISFLSFHNSLAKQTPSSKRPLYLVIGPKSTVTNWDAELKKFCPSLTSVIFMGTNDERVDIYNTRLDPKNPAVDSPDVILTSFDMIIRERILLKSLSYDVMIMDEAHRLKNSASVLSKTLRTFRTDRRILLTGTPLQNNLTELWSLLNFLDPKLFKCADQFNDLFSFAGLNSTDQAMKAVRALHKTLGAFVLRRLKSDVLTGMPPKTEILLFVPLTNLQKQIYAGLVDKTLGSFVENMEMSGGNSQMALKALPRTSVMNVLMQLRKCCNHPYLFEGVEPEPFVEGEHLIEASSKLKLLDKLLPKLFSEGSRVLIFSQMTKVLDIISDWLNFRRIKHLRIDGNTGSSERQESIENFNKPGTDVDIFILSTRAGGLGINLATADVVILFDSDFNPQMDLQAMDRAHRIGQKKPVRVFRLVTDGTVEEKIVERALKKLKIDALVSAGRKKQLRDRKKGDEDKNELAEMVKHGAADILKVQQTGSEEEGFEINIDEILEAAEKRTKNVQEQLSKFEDAIKGVETMDLSEALFKSNPLTAAQSNELENANNEALEDILLMRKRADFELKKKMREDSRIVNRSANVVRVKKQRVKKEGWRLELGTLNAGGPHQLFDAQRLDEIDKIKINWESLVQDLSDGYQRVTENCRKNILLILESEGLPLPSDTQTEKKNQTETSEEILNLLPLIVANGLLSKAKKAVEKIQSELEANQEKSEEEVNENETDEVEVVETCAKSSSKKSKKDSLVVYSVSLNEERNKLLSEGFLSWTRREFLILLDALERHSLSPEGREAAEDCLLPQKSKEAVRTYLNKLLDEGFYENIPGASSVIEGIKHRMEREKKQTATINRIKVFAQKLNEETNEDLSVASGSYLPNTLKNKESDLLVQLSADALTNKEREIIFCSLLSTIEQPESVFKSSIRRMASTNLMLLTATQKSVDFAEECKKVIMKSAEDVEDETGEKSRKRKRAA